MRVYYDPSAQHAGLRQQLINIKLLERFKQFLSPIRLPQPLLLRTRECGEANMFYQHAFHAQTLRLMRLLSDQLKDPIVLQDTEATIVLCYEFFLENTKNAPATAEGGITRDDVLVGGIVGTVLHEAGHALFDLLRVPVLGREEDAADQLAALVLLHFNPDLAKRMIKGMAFALRRMTGANVQEINLMSIRFADEHGTPSQRFFNTLCMAYGRDPEGYKDIAAQAGLPAQRLKNCGNEYREVEFAFAKTVLPHIDPSLMRKVQASPDILTLGLVQ